MPEWTLNGKIVTKTFDKKMCGALHIEDCQIFKNILRLTIIICCSIK